MRRGIGLAALTLATLASTAARADYEGRVIGNWIVSAKDDRFGDGGTYLALAPGDGIIFGVRCLQKDLSAALLVAQQNLKPKDIFAFKFRIDKEPVVEAVGIAIDEKLIEISIDGGLVKQMQGGKELAIRMTTATYSSTSVVKLRGASKAFADIVKECPIEKPAKKTDEAGASKG